MVAGNYKKGEMIMKKYKEKLKTIEEYEIEVMERYNKESKGLSIIPCYITVACGKPQKSLCILLARIYSAIHTMCGVVGIPMPS